MGENITKVIKIGQLELLEWGVKIKDSDMMVFNLSEKKKDGSTSEAYQQYQQMNLKIGSVVELWYAEVPNKHGGISRYIRSFKEANEGQLGSNTPQPTNPSPKPNSYVSEQPEQESRQAYGRRLAIHGEINSLLASGMKPEEITNQIIDSVMELDGRIEEKLKNYNNHTVMVEDIPF